MYPGQRELRTLVQKHYPASFIMALFKMLYICSVVFMNVVNFLRHLLDGGKAG